MSIYWLNLTTDFYVMRWLKCWHKNKKVDRSRLVLRDDEYMRDATAL